MTSIARGSELAHPLGGPSLLGSRCTGSMAPHSSQLPGGPKQTPNPADKSQQRRRVRHGLPDVRHRGHAFLLSGKLVRATESLAARRLGKIAKVPVTESGNDLDWEAPVPPAFLWEPTSPSRPWRPGSIPCVIIIPYPPHPPLHLHLMYVLCGTVYCRYRMYHKTEMAIY